MSNYHQILISQDQVHLSHLYATNLLAISGSATYEPYKLVGILSIFSILGFTGADESNSQEPDRHSQSQIRNKRLPHLLIISKYCLCLSYRMMVKLLVPKH